MDLTTEIVLRDGTHHETTGVDLASVDRLVGWLANSSRGHIYITTMQGSWRVDPADVTSVQIRADFR